MGQRARTFPGAEASLKLCTFIYAAMTIAGALSFLPGGLGVQEGGMVALLVSTAIPEPSTFTTVVTSPNSSFTSSLRLSFT